MLQWMLRQVIQDTYEKEFGHKNGQEGKNVMQFDISLNLDHDKEDGYRWIEVRLAWSGYVGVFIRECWNVVPVEGLDPDDDAGLLPGFDYKIGSTPWDCLSCHDSCWASDGLYMIFSKYADKMGHFRNLGNWYTSTPLTPELDKELREILNKSRS